MLYNIIYNLCNLSYPSVEAVTTATFPSNFLVVLIDIIRRLVRKIDRTLLNFKTDMLFETFAYVKSNTGRQFI